MTSVMDSDAFGDAFGAFEASLIDDDVQPLPDDSAFDFAFDEPLPSGLAVNDFSPLEFGSFGDSQPTEVSIPQGHARVAMDEFQETLPVNGEVICIDDQPANESVTELPSGGPPLGSPEDQQPACNNSAYKQPTSVETPVDVSEVAEKPSTVMVMSSEPDNPPNDTPKPKVCTARRSSLHQPLLPEKTSLKRLTSVLKTPLELSLPTLRSTTSWKPPKFRLNSETPLRLNPTDTSVQTPLVSQTHSEKCGLEPVDRQSLRSRLRNKNTESSRGSSTTTTTTSSHVSNSPVSETKTRSKK
eukprot:Blabericola_migrator_1__5716@NODE_28_length_19984_cov_212_654667_g25_i0_p9_GENE_NODE_28_length_19984_cov_212_654667_g25_i0NODE_28_length_19984_cov_212_654667_g25_i0_p9_ORF_typecomplete_len299_score49_79_NODE_28_length_19984_cov_212_654667_g25_i048655761